MRGLLASVGLGARLGSLALAAACGASAPAQTPDSIAPSEQPAAGAPAPEEAQAGATMPEGATSGSGGAHADDADDGLDADIAELAASTQAGDAATLPEPAAPAAAPAREKDALSGRDVVYRVTPKGLVIEIDGFHLRPEAKPFRDSSGSYGVQLVLRAESFDGRQFWVDTPKEGPLSIAGKVQSKDGKVQRFSDERGAPGDERVVLSDAPHTFEQRWPGRGQPKLREGQTLTLEVGLWGVRAESERERPVRRLFTVKMVAGKKSPAVIEPPAMDWGS
jgi:hypothetical protein